MSEISTPSRHHGIEGRSYLERIVDARREECRCECENDNAHLESKIRERIVVEKQLRNVPND